MAIDPEAQVAIDNLFILVCALMVFLLQPGFGLLEAGAVRSKNAANIMLKNMMDSAIGALAFWAIGFGLANGKGNKFAGNEYFFLSGNEDYIGWFFQYVFAGTAATIVSGAVAERCRFRAYLVYASFITGIVYPIGTHWIWNSNGFLADKVLDFAGSGAVHLVGGAAAMAGAWVVGPRIGRFETDSDGKIQVNEIQGHNQVLAALGTFLLWFGFLPFNAGSNLAIASYEDTVVVGRCIVVTVLAASSGATSLLLWGLYYHASWDMNYAINGLLAGMVATCAGVNLYDPWIAVVVGIIGAAFYILQVQIFENVLRIDDPLNAAAVHMGGGIAGLICVGFLAKGEYVDNDDDMTGIFYGGTGLQLGYQLYGGVVWFLWSFGTCFPMFMGLNAIGWLRVSKEAEEEGMDLYYSGHEAYNSSGKTAAAPAPDGKAKDAAEEEEVADEATELKEGPTGNALAEGQAPSGRRIEMKKARSTALMPGLA